MTDELRTQLVQLLRGGQAHMPFDAAVADFPAWAINQRFPNGTYTPWHLVEHLRLTQADMPSYIEDPGGYVAVEWPVGFWPDPSAETDEAGFAKSVAGFKAGLRAMEKICLDESRDLTAVLEGTPGHTALRGLMIIGNHNSYHLGEFAGLRQVMGSWPKSHD